MLRSSPLYRVPSLAVGALAWLGVLLAAPAALAQTAPVEPYFAATAQADVPLRSGDMDGYYPIATLPKDQVLRVDAEGAGWARVSYPPGLTVYVAAADVRREGGDVVLTKLSALKSRNASAGFAQSWQRAVPRNSDLPSGTRLRVVEPVNGPDGEPIGYVVEPPQAVRAYVKAEHLRVATEAEVQAYRALAGSPEPEPVAQDAPPPIEDEPEPVTSGEQEVQQPVAEPREEEDSLLEPMQPSGDSPGGQEDAGTETPAQPTDPGVTVIDQSPTPEDRQIGTLQHLSDAFTEVQSQPSETAELDELAAEFRRAIAAQGDDDIGRRMRAGLEQRLQFLELRIEARDKRRELAARREAIDASMQTVTSRVRELERTRGYQFVGRLVRSSVYDGERLPLMYRMVSVNESTPRTIGYIDPGETDLGLEDKLGEIVGVLGTSSLDESLRLRIVSPTRVDVLQPEGVGVPEPATASGEESGA